ncbi:hypothetical protein BZG01_16630 [Labilibaculum manganireducens]|uniref:Uncharacterized protein n=1 Tax=Labilibaculum manganireducens TaxID=1940525 RepID=A0A2N3HXX5_9BACT|nr:hypothetical protein [Labilibaculum manganireducens]PKQ62909.1 hypothetical protein BZG01_16630 [Labilibaculum manganireducens]
MSGFNTIVISQKRFIDISLSEIMEKLLYAGVINTISSLIKKSYQLLKKSRKPNRYEEKNYMITNICRLYEFPKFEIEDVWKNGELRKVFYEVSIDLLKKFKVKDTHRLEYISKNFGVRTNNQGELVKELKRKLNDSNDTDFPYKLGFRSIYVLISDNMKKVKEEDLFLILRKLKPFFKSFKYPER